MTMIDDAINAVLAAEGGYVNDPRDSGGETNFGITVATARQQGYTGPMRDMPRSFAVEVYRRQYVIAPGFDQIGVISQAIGARLVDIGVNMGPTVAGRFLQRALNALNNGGKDWGDIAADGNAGPVTRGALNAFLAKRGPKGEAVLLFAIKALQAERYISLAEANIKNEAFEYGWLTRAAA